MKLGQESLRLISNLKNHNLVRGFPSLMNKTNLLCDACQKGNKLEDLLSPKIFFLLLDYLVLPKQPYEWKILWTGCG
ncbi:hypothetical protein CR513_50253, partial [Mucuna pruriens]